jgi:hypothetical protein
MAGGTVAAKAFGPTIERAAVPTGRELKDIAGKGYNSAVQETGLTLDPKGPASWAANLKQDLGGARFSGTNGSAPKTMAALDELQSPPFRIEGLDRVTPTVVTASNLDELRKTLGTIAQEVQLSTGGALKATPDAAAATRALEQS